MFFISHAFDEAAGQKRDRHETLAAKKKNVNTRIYFSA